MKESKCCTATTKIAVVDIETNQFYGKDVNKIEMPFFNCDADLTDRREVFFEHQLSFAQSMEKAFADADRITFSVIREALVKATEDVKSLYDVDSSLLDEAECRTMQAAFAKGSPFKMKALPIEINLVGVMQLYAGTVFDAKDQVELAEILKSAKEFHSFRDSNNYKQEGYYAFSNMKQANAYFEQFIKYHEKSENGIGAIYAHNVNYEWSMLFRKMPCLEKAVKEGKLGSLRGTSKNNIKTATVFKDAEQTEPVVQILDSFLYQRTSLKKIGAAYKFPKDTLNYEVEFKPNLVERAIRSRKGLSKADDDYNHLIDYNKIDCSIPFLIIHEGLRRYDILLADTDKGFPASYPISANQINRKIMEQECKGIYIHRFRDEKDKFHEIMDDKPAKHIVTDKQGNPKLDENGNVQYEADKSIVDVWKRECGEASIVAENKEDRKNKTIIPELFLKCKAVAGGGMVGINPFIANQKIITEEGQTGRHIDLVSAHPSQAFKRYFPSGLPKECDETTTAKILSGLEMAEKMMIQKRDNPYKAFTVVTEVLQSVLGTLRHVSGFATFTLKNVRIKRWNSLGRDVAIPCMPFEKAKKKYSGDEVEGETIVDMYNIATSEIAICTKALKESKTKEELLEKDLVVDNKVYNLKEHEITCTFEDLLVYSLFYDWTEMTAKDMYKYEMRSCPAYLYYTFKLYSIKKTIYKNIETMIKEGKEIASYMEENKAFINETDIRYLLEHSTDMDYSHQATQKTKGVFNGIYGQNYQSNIHAGCTYDVDETEGIVETNLCDEYSASSNRNYLVSAYIAQWSRVDLAFHLAYVIAKGALPLYWATDSIFYLEDKEVFDSENGKLGKTIRGNFVKPFNAQDKWLKQARPYDERATLGGMDYEANWTKFATSQNLRNIYECELKVKINGEKVKKTGSILTFSGCNADGAFEGTGLFKDDEGKTYYDFDKASERMCEKDRYISPLKTKKSTKSKASDGTYALLPQGFILNNSDSLGNQIRYLLAR